MLLAGLKRVGLQSPNLVRNASFYCCSRPFAQPSSPIRPRVFLRFASVKSDLPPATKAPKGSNKAVGSSPVGKTKPPRSSVAKSIPASVEKGAPSLVTKAASVLAKDTAAENADPVAKSPPTKSPPQKAHPPPPTETNVLSASIAPKLPSAEGSPAPPPSSAVGIWLMLSSVLVLAVVIVGGITRLTESGLSITEWRPITGIMPPSSTEAWEEEFAKYKATPEFKMLNHSITLDDFKRIYYMEWSHRILGRLIGVAFVAPLAYFTITKKISTPLAVKLFGLGLLIGVQGAMGWYMVQSGLEDSLLETPGAVPRVSHYRLAAHLGLAFALYIGMFTTGMTILKDSRFMRTGMASGLPIESLTAALNNPIVRRFKSYSLVLAGLVLLTALSGVFVAGLDAGLVYNEWPLMGGRLAPPADELFSPAYAKSESKSDLWRNIFENPTTVQFDHRLLATTTYAGLAVLFAQTFRPAWRTIIPPLAITSARAAFAMANVQVLLGISTLIYLVPVPLAAAHQGGSILLLSAMLHLLISLRRPSTAARAWRTVAKPKTTNAPRT
ncbi:cytochrome oxidase assembly protein-domain-containing protein [Mycena albidolilacea]|uniref:Cytochrome oxidase assembly protein-domain-containing protein n=1 Tax=Mycena albidolilacea TaxID=1033008 RepID=A0AAD7F6D8_9AGAR|nr:cytochrome oxidase assembly protein-domain-containing protein [Mycena albidolilacea]